MSNTQIEKRLRDLEIAVRRIEAEQRAAAKHRWWREGAGRFAGDPVFAEILKLGRRYRSSNGRSGRATNRVKKP